MPRHNSRGVPRPASTGRSAETPNRAARVERSANTDRGPAPRPAAAVYVEVRGASCTVLGAAVNRLADGAGALLPSLLAVLASDVEAHSLGVRVLRSRGGVLVAALTDFGGERA
jgi:hypothetical protein